VQKKIIAKILVFFENYLFDPRIGLYGPKIVLEIVFSGSLVSAQNLDFFSAIKFYYQKVPTAK
jgi:hypothetical protein